MEEMLEQLQEQSRLQNEFINVAAHELRTPILPILMMSESIQGKLVDKHEIEMKEIAIVTRNAKRLQNLIQDILDVTRIEIQTLKLNKQDFNLTEVISGVA